MTAIDKNDLVNSIEKALQYISYYHPKDYIQHLTKAYDREESEAARDAMAQILTSSKMSALGQRPICQDTGIVNVFLDIGMDVQWRNFDGTGIEDAVNEGVKLAYTNPDNPLRASVIREPLFNRINTKNNTPAIVQTRLVPGNKLKVSIAAKGGGSENKAQLVMMNPGDDLVSWILETVPKLGAGWCPPGILGIGVGGTAEKAVLMAKQSLLEPLNMLDLYSKFNSGEQLTDYENLRKEIYEKVNNLGIGAQGLGGLTTVLDIKINTYPTHAASKPVALIPNCAANRHIDFELDGSGPVELTPPDMNMWPDLKWQPSSKCKRVNLDDLSKENMRSWEPGDSLLLTGKILTGRDAAHKRIQEFIAEGKPLPVDFKDRVIYYVGPVSPVGDEVIGPAGPTTATRMDNYTDMMLDKTGLLAMIGKAERGPVAIDAIKKHSSAYLIAVGGAAFLVSKAIKKSRLVAFEDLGMEAIYEFDVVDMPVTVAVTSTGDNIHEIGPENWCNKCVYHI